MARARFWDRRARRFCPIVDKIDFSVTGPTDKVWDRGDHGARGLVASVMRTKSALITAETKWRRLEGARRITGSNHWRRVLRWLVEKIQVTL